MSSSVLEAKKEKGNKEISTYQEMLFPEGERIIRPEHWVTQKEFRRTPDQCGSVGGVVPHSDGRRSNWGSHSGSAFGPWAGRV